jgi:hypothetical protein
MTRRPPSLLPEEDVLDDPDEDDEADPTLPGDLWFFRDDSTAVLPPFAAGKLSAASYTCRWPRV